MRLICITGPDGCGKSTLIAGLASRLHGELGLCAREVSVWDLMRAGLSFPIDPRGIDEYLAVLGPRARAHFLLHCLAGALERALSADADLLLIDSYWYKYLATEVAYGADEATMAGLTAGLPEPELVLYLDVPVAVAAARKERFSGYESGFPAIRDSAAFAGFQARIRPVLARWRAARGWIAVDGTGSPEAVLDAAWHRLKIQLGRGGRGAV